jgi:hypothetical protein
MLMQPHFLVTTCVESEGKVIKIGRDGCLLLLSLLSEMASFAGSHEIEVLTKT